MAKNIRILIVLMMMVVMLSVGIVRGEVNEAPYVNAGEDREVVAGEGIKLKGEVRDEGKVNVQWSVIKREGNVEFENENAVETVVKFGGEGEYVLKLEANDGELRGWDEVRVLVKKSGGPVGGVNAGEDQTIRLGANVLRNGGGEEGISGWKVIDGGWKQSENLPQSIEGKSYLVGETTKTAVIEQEIDVRGMSREVEIRGYVRSKVQGAYTHLGIGIVGYDTERRVVWGGGSNGTYVWSGKWSEFNGTVQLNERDAYIVLRYECRSDVGANEFYLDGMTVRFKESARVRLNGKVESGMNAEWNVVSGPGTVVFGNRNQADTTAIFSKEGMYELELKGSSEKGEERDRVQIRVEKVNLAPKVKIGEDESLYTITGKTEKKLSAEVEDDGLVGPLSKEWRVDRGEIVEGINEDKAKVVLRGVGEFYVGFVANDGENVTVAYRKIEIRSYNTRPKVDAGPDVEVRKPNNWADLQVKIDDDGELIGGEYRIEWKLVNGPGTVSFSNQNGQLTRVNLSELGDYVFRVDVSDFEYTASDEIVVRYREEMGGRVPEVNAGPDREIELGDALRLKGEVEGYGNEIKVRWDKVSGEEVSFSNREKLETEVKFGKVGDYLLRLTADDGGLRGSDDVKVRVKCSGEVKPLDLMLVIDDSVSMVRNPDLFDWDGDKVAKEIGNGLMDYMRLGVDRVGLVRFNSDGKLLVGLDGTIKATRKELDKLGMQGGASYVYGGLEVAEGELKKGRSNAEKMIVVVSDGGFEYWEEIPNRIKGEGIKIVTICIGCYREAPRGWPSHEAIEKIASSLVDHYKHNFQLDTPLPREIVNNIAGKECRINKIPAVDAGEEKVVYLGEETKLEGSVKDDGDKLEIGWSKVSGRGEVIFGDLNKANTSVRFNAVGEYELKLEASDGEWRNSDVVKITVLDGNAVNRAPEVKAGEDQIIRMGGNLLRSGGGEKGREELIGVSGNWDVVEGESYEGTKSLKVEKAIYPQMLIAADLRGLKEEIGGGDAKLSWHEYVKMNNEQGAFTTYLECLDEEKKRVSSFDGGTPEEWLNAKEWTRFKIANIELDERSGNSRIRYLALKLGLYGGLEEGIYWIDGVVMKLLNTRYAIAWMRGEVTDDFLPKHGKVEVRWKKISGPGDVRFADEKSLETNVVFKEVGLYELELEVSDGEKVSSSRVKVEVKEEPQIRVAGELAEGVNGKDYYSKLRGEGGEEPYYFEVAEGEFPRGISLSRNGEIKGIGSVSGEFKFKVRAIDRGGYEATRDYVLKLKPGQNDCGLSLYEHPLRDGEVGKEYIEKIVINRGTAAEVKIEITRGQLPKGFRIEGDLLRGTPEVAGEYEFTIKVTTITLCEAERSYQLKIVDKNCGDMKILPEVLKVGEIGTAYEEELKMEGGEGPYKYRITRGELPEGLKLEAGKISGIPTKIGESGIDIEAEDKKGCKVIVTRVIRVTNKTELTAEIVSPSDGTNITTKTEVKGTAVGEAWKLEIQGGGEGSDKSWKKIAEGTEEVRNNKLGIVDPTLMLNGVYTLKLTTSRGGKSVETTSSIVVEGGQKIGNFTVSFSDMKVSTGGIPIEVVRTYDSRDKEVGDFGIGWKLGIKGIKIEKTVEEGKYWQQTLTSGLFPKYEVRPTKNSRVVVTIGEKQYRFVGVVSPSSSITPIQYGTVGYAAERLGKLEVYPESPSGVTNIAVIGEVPTAENPAVVVELQDQETLKIYNPQTYKFTDERGVEYVIDIKGGLKKIKDLNGNWIELTNEGIKSSSGKGIEFKRDAKGRIEKIVDPAGNEVKYTYDANGDLIVVTDREGKQTTHSYNSNHYLEKIVDSRGIQILKNDYTAEGRLTRQGDANGKEIKYEHDYNRRVEIVVNRFGYYSSEYEYDERGNVARKRDEHGMETRYAYDSRDNKIREINAAGEEKKYEYDERDNKIREVDALGKETRWEYDKFGRVTKIVDAKGNTTTNSYDINGNLLSTIDASGAETKYEYNKIGQVTKQIDAMGGISTYEYDGNGNTIREVDPTGNEVKYSYDTNGNRLTQETSAGITKYVYDKEGRVVRTTYADGTKTETEYNEIGKVVVSRDQKGIETKYEYDGLGQLKRTTYPDKTVEESTYDVEGRKITSKDRGGRETNYQYDGIGRLIKTTYADGTSVSTQYDQIGRVMNTKDSKGNVTRYEYERCGCGNRRSKSIDAKGNVTQYKYDEVGNQISVIDGKGRETKYEYDKNNRRTKTTYADGTVTETQYDKLGRKIKEIDQEKRATEYRYDKAGRLISVVDARGKETRYEYNNLGQQTKQIDALGRITTYEYDAMGRRTKRTMPGGEAETYEYDEVGNIKKKKDFRGKETTYEYDVANRLTKVTPDGTLGETTIKFTYTATNRRETVEDSSGTTKYSYDVRDRVTKKETPNGTLNYNYDENGNETLVTSNNPNGVDTKYQYDELNRIVGVNGTKYSYDEVGNLTNNELSNGVKTTYTYNNVNRLKEMNSGVASYSYTLNSIGNRIKVRENGVRDVVYKYDEVSRLTEEKVIGVGAISYSYDDVGNRQTRTSTVPGILTTTYSYNSNDQFTTDTYDSNGNTTKSNTTTYEYDFENRIKSVKTPTTNTTITYDADGNRTSKTVNGVTTKYLVDTNNPTGYAQVVEEIQSGKVTKTYTYGLNLISQKDTTTAKTSYYGYDGQNVRYLTDDKGKVTDTYTYDAFGTLINKTGSTENNYLYAGEQYDPDLNFYYNRARYLNTETGRFQTRDSFEGIIYNPNTLHKYTYVENNPINKIDPSGRESVAGLMGNLSISLPIRAMSNLQAIGIAASITCALDFAVTGALNEAGADVTAVTPCDARNNPNRVYRGTDRFSENRVFNETGHILSDAAIEAYIENGGSLSKAYSIAAKTHLEWIQIWGNEIFYAQAHGVFGIEMGRVFDKKRTFVSVTRSLEKARMFAGTSPNSRVYTAIVPRWEMVPQTYTGAGEGEWLIRLGRGGFSVYK